MSLCLNRGNDLATVPISALCIRLLSNNSSLQQMYNNLHEITISLYWNNLQKQLNL